MIEYNGSIINYLILTHSYQVRDLLFQRFQFLSLLKLRDSDREEIREFYPGKTAEEMFLI